MKASGRVIAGLALLAVFVPLASGCSAPAASSDGFAIYLTSDNVPPSQMEMLSHIEVADEPIVSMDDIVSYDASNHEMTLTEDAYQRLAELQVPTSGQSFVVCVDGGPIYWGAFWALYSSQSFDGITIWLPLILDESPVVQIRRGYPWTITDVLNDPRNNAQIFAALEQAGKLTGTPQPEITALPHSMKGYELYSWQYDGRWYFTLITGTNRNKTIEEILTIETTVGTDGWVHVYATSVEQLEAALSLLPEGEFVTWFSQFYGEGGQAVSLPPQDIVDAVTNHAARCGLDFFVAPR